MFHIQRIDCVTADRVQQTHLYGLVVAQRRLREHKEPLLPVLHLRKDGTHGRATITIILYMYYYSYHRGEIALYSQAQTVINWSRSRYSGFRFSVIKKYTLQLPYVCIRPEAGVGARVQRLVVGRCTHVCTCSYSRWASVHLRSYMDVTMAIKGKIQHRLFRQT